MHRVQKWLEARWWDGARAPLWLRALSGLFGAVSRLRRGLYRRGLLSVQRLPVPVIVVGNITVGGSGKTPVVIALVERLRAAGRTPGVISRGYGGSGEGVREVPPDGDAPAFGDEPVLIKRRTLAPVAVARDRAAAGRLLIERHGIDVIVADDGLQHYPLARDVEIVVVDGCRRFGNGRLLPAGPLREPAARLREADIVLVNGAREPHELGFDLALGDAVALTNGERRPLASFTGRRVHAVAGIGDPSRFFAALRNAGLDIVEHAFPDHYAFAAHDMNFGDDAPVLMTEKDAVKCVGFAQPHWFSVPADVQLPEAALAHISKQLANADSGRR